MKIDKKRFKSAIDYLQLINESELKELDLSDFQDIESEERIADREFIGLNNSDHITHWCNSEGEEKTIEIKEKRILFLKGLSDLMEKFGVNFTLTAWTGGNVLSKLTYDISNEVVGDESCLLFNSTSITSDFYSDDVDDKIKVLRES